MRRLLLAAAITGILAGSGTALATTPDAVHPRPAPCTPGAFREETWRPGSWQVCKPDHRWHREQDPTRPLPDPIPA